MNSTMDESIRGPPVSKTSFVNVRSHVREKGKAGKIGSTGTALGGMDEKDIQYATSVELRRL